MGQISLQAIYIICSVFVFHAVRFMSEAGEAAIPRLQCAQIPEIGTVIAADVLARHQHRNAGRIRHNAGCHNPICHLVDRNMFDFVVHQFRIGIGRELIQGRAASRRPHPVLSIDSFLSSARTSHPPNRAGPCRHSARAHLPRRRSTLRSSGALAS